MGSREAVALEFYSSGLLGGAKAKATVGLSKNTQEKLPDGFEHWHIKFDDREKYAKEVGRNFKLLG